MMNDRLEKITSLHTELERLRVKIEDLEDESSKKIYSDQFSMIEIDANKLEDESTSYEIFSGHVERILGAIRNMMNHLNLEKA